MARIAKPESFVLLSPSKEDVRITTALPLVSAHLTSFHTGGQAKRCGMHSTHHGTLFVFLHQPGASVGLPISLPKCDDCL